MNTNRAHRKEEHCDRIRGLTGALCELTWCLRRYHLFLKALWQTTHGTLWLGAWTFIMWMRRFPELLNQRWQMEQIWAGDWTTGPLSATTTRKVVLYLIKTRDNQKSIQFKQKPQEHMLFKVIIQKYLDILNQSTM